MNSFEYIAQEIIESVVDDIKIFDESLLLQIKQKKKKKAKLSN